MPDAAEAPRPAPRRVDQRCGGFVTARLFPRPGRSDRKDLAGQDTRNGLSGHGPAVPVRDLADLFGCGSMVWTGDGADLCRAGATVRTRRGGLLGKHYAAGARGRSRGLDQLTKTGHDPVRVA